jgi:hypothetical protein
VVRMAGGVSVVRVVRTVLVVRVERRSEYSLS